MLFRSWVALVLCLAAGLGWSAEIILHDAFKPDLRRTWNLSRPPGGAEAWQLEQEIPFAHERLNFRFFSGVEQVRQLSLRNRGGEEVWRADAPKGAVMTPVLPADTYTLTCLGQGGEAPFNMVVNSYVGGYLLPSWTVSAAQAEPVSGQGVRLWPQADGQPGRLSGRLFRLVPGEYYTLVLEVESDLVQELLVRMTQRPEGRRFSETARMRTQPGQVRRWTVPVSALTASMDLTLEFSQACRVQALTLASAPPPPPSKQKKAGEKVFTFEPRAAQADPANPALTGPVLFRRSPRQLYRTSVPQDFERIDTVSAFSVPGEYAVWHFAVHNPGAERVLRRLEPGDLEDGGGHRLPAAGIAVSQVEFWDYPRGPYTYYEIPELIQPQEEVTLGAGENRIFWLQTRLPEDCAPGRYAMRLEVRCGDSVLPLELNLRVLPFRLRTPPDMVWSVYSRMHVKPQSGYSDELSVRYLRDMLDYGVTSLHRTLGGEKSVENFQRVRRAAGMRGPVLVYGMRAEAAAAERCGKPLTERWFDDPEQRQAFVAVIRDFDGWMKKYGGDEYADWYYMGADEPHIRSMELAGWQNRLAREAGVRTASCVYAPRYVNELAPHLDLSCNSFIGQNQETWQELQAIGTRHRLGYWFLGGGCYGGQEGGLMPNRLHSGFQSYKLGVTGHLSYTYQAYQRGPIGPMDNFSAGKSYAMTYPVARPTTERVSIFTLEWEGIREGITDYKYLYTLEAMIAEARQAGRNQAAAAAQRSLDEILGRIPWTGSGEGSVNGLSEPQTFSNDTAEKLRTLAAAAIMTLQEGK